MRLPRFRLRTLMIVVAVTALAMGIEVARRRPEEFRSRAEEWRRKARIADYSRNEVLSEYPNGDLPPDSDTARRAERYRRQGYFYRAMKVKYEEAAAHPWRLVAPDPPEPK